MLEILKSNNSIFDKVTFINKPRRNEKLFDIKEGEIEEIVEE